MAHPVQAPMSAPPVPPPPPAAGRLVSPDWTARWFGVQARLEPTDRMRSVTWLTVVTIAVAATCAAIGRIPFDLPMPTHLIGMVCPTCGLTRGTVAISRGHFALAFHYNPLSFTVPIAAALIMARLLAGLLRGRWINVRYRPTRLAWTTAAIALGALWIYQQSHAMFIMHSHIV